LSVSVQPPLRGPGRELAKRPETRYNRGMIETTLLLAADQWAPTLAPDPAPLLEQLVTLRLEIATLRAENAVL
jgi:hypothetical protein